MEQFDKGISSLEKYKREKIVMIKRKHRYSEAKTVMFCSSFSRGSHVRYVTYIRITKTRLIYGTTDQERTGGEKPTDSIGNCGVSCG